MSKSSANTLLKSTFVYAIGNVSSKLISFLLVPIISFYLTKSDLGIYDLVITGLNLLVPIFTIQISNGVYRWLLDFNRKIKISRRVIFTGLIINLIGIFLFAVLYLIFYKLFNIVLDPLIAILLVASNSLFTFFQFVIRGIAKNKFFSISGIVNSVFLLLFNTILLAYFKLGLNSLFYAIIFSNLIATLYLIIKIDFRDFFSFSFLNGKIAKRMANYSVPLIPNQISWWLINASDKFIILAVLSTEMNGIYAISSRFPSIMILLNSIFIMAWQDYTITDKKNDISENTKIFNRYMTLQFSLLFILVPTSEFLVKALVDHKFYESYKYMPLLYLSVVFSSLAGYYGAIYLRSKNTKGIFFTSFLGGIINVIIAYTLMPVIGLYASCWGSVISFMVVLALRIHQTKETINLNFPFKKFGILMSLSFGIILFTLFGNHLINIILAFLGLSYFIFINKSMITNLIKRTKNI